ncbi:MAG TPA: nodulation protein NfeD [Candidatus Limnocylindria bacterium]|nr:nodulation protein NfeD [Candidatus Limnocylindria bacterium]
MKPPVHTPYSLRGIAASVCGWGRRWGPLAVFLWLAAAWGIGGSLAAVPGPVMVATIATSINPVTADFLSSAIERAEEEKATLLVIELDTPGGLDTSMRQMVQEIIRTPVPVAVYVSPPGSRAASAGVLVTLAADIAAMAPGTNIGAAHPVGIGGGGMDNTMARKVENDAAAYARSLAEKKGRNGEWAEKAVRESASLTETDAKKQRVIDLVAPSLKDLLSAIDGRVIEKGGEKVTLRTKGAEITLIPMGFRHRVLSALADPTIAYILMMIGIYGIFFELSNPGAVFPGVVGGISLILGFYSLQTLSANYAGFLLIALAMILFILEIKIASHGALTLGGIISLALGSIMLFRSSADPYLRISWGVILTMVGLTAVFFGTVVTLAVRSQLRQPATGSEGMIGETGVAVADFTGKGKVFVVGELWDAECLLPLRKGDKVTVVKRKEMTLVVKPQEMPR